MEARKEDLEKLLGVLTHMRLRPGMYFSSDMPGVYTYLNGFKTACHLLGVDISINESVIWSERGWKTGPLHPIKQMQEKGMSEAKITEELLTSLILTLVRSYSLSTQPVLEIHDWVRNHINEKDSDASNAKTSPITQEDELSQSVIDLKRMHRLEEDLGISNESCS
jgi:hypothetical protein